MIGSDKKEKWKCFTWPHCSLLPHVYSHNMAQNRLHSDIDPGAIISFNLSQICIVYFFYVSEYVFQLIFYNFCMRATYTCVLEKHSSLVFKRGWPDMPQVSRYSCELLLSIPGSCSSLLANLHHKRRISKQKMAVFFDPSLVKQQIVTASVLAE